ncbi:MAG: Pol I core factor CF [Stictis urceolatum]|nr:Pol I core factor CF [Stictis urceolata]
MNSSAGPSIDYYKADKCGVCGIKTWYNDEEGFRTCKKGHQDQSFRQTQNAEEEYLARGSQGQTTRMRRDQQEKQTRFLKGIEALKLYLSCYQIILRHQCWELIQKKKFPAELEILVRDLWALRIPRILDRVGSRLRLDDETDDEGEISGPKYYSSQNDSTAGETDAEGVIITKEEKRRELPSLVDSLALLYMAMVVRRCPVSTADLHRWASAEEITFIRPLRLIPADVRRNLSTRWINLLETHHALKPDDINHSLRRMLYHYHRHYELALPPLNYEPLLYRYIRDLALPLQLFTSVQTLATLLSTPFTYPTHKPHKSTHQPLPELSLFSLLTIVIKLYHPFSSPTLYARSVTDPAYLTLDWPTWSSARTRHAQILAYNKPFLPGAQMSVRETDVFNLESDQLDSYMDWYEKTWTAPARTDVSSRDLPQDLIDMFPTEHPVSLGPVQPSRRASDAGKEFGAAEERLERVVGSLQTRPIISDQRAQELGGVPRVGSRYEVFPSEETLGGVAREFHEAVAERAAVSLDVLLKEVRRVEGRLERWRRDRASEKRKAAVGKPGVEDEDEEMGV